VSKLEYILGVRTDGTQSAREIDRVSDSVKRLDQHADGVGNTFAGLAKRLTAILGPLAVFRELTGTFNRFGKIADDAKRAGVSAEKFQAWSQALQESGIQPEAVFTANRTLTRQQVAAMEASRGGKTTDVTEAFRRLGIPMEYVQTAGREQLLETVAMQAAKGPTEGPAASQLSSDLQTLLGRDADSLLSAFRDGFLDKVRTAAEQGLILRESDVAVIDEAGDKLARAALRARVVEARAIAGVASGNVLDAAANGPYRFGPTLSDVRALEEAVRRGNSEVVKKLDEKL